MTATPPEDDPGVLERLDAGEPPRSPEEAQARAPYERLLGRIRDLDDVAPPSGWEDRAAARWSSARRKRRAGIVLGLTAAAAVAAALLIRPCTPPAAEPGLQVAVSTPPGTPHRGYRRVGDVLHARARLDRAHVDLRIYLDTRLVARCPGAEPCRRNASLVELDWEVVEPGTYRIVRLSSASDIPPPVGGIERDLLEARNAGASREIETLSVRQ